MEEKKKGISPILIVILSIIGTCLIIFGVYYVVNHFKEEEKTDDKQPNVETSGNIVKCGNHNYNLLTDKKNEVGSGGAGTGFEFKIYYMISSDSTVQYYYDGSYSLCIDDEAENLDECDKYDEGEYKTELSSFDSSLKCEYLLDFEFGEGVSKRYDDSSIPAALCYNDGKYYEIGHTLKTGTDGTKALNYEPYYEEVTQYCKIN